MTTCPSESREKKKRGKYGKKEKISEQLEAVRGLHTMSMPLVERMVLG